MRDIQTRTVCEKEELPNPIRSANGIGTPFWGVAVKGESLRHRKRFKYLLELATRERINK